MQSYQKWNFYGNIDTWLQIWHSYSFDISTVWGVCFRWASTFETGFSQNSSSSRKLLHFLIDSHIGWLRKWPFLSLSLGLISSRWWGVLSSKSRKDSLSLVGRSTKFPNYQSTFLTTLLQKLNHFESLIFMLLFQFNSCNQIKAISHTVELHNSRKNGRPKIFYYFGVFYYYGFLCCSR